MMNKSKERASFESLCYIIENGEWLGQGKTK